MPKYAFLSDEWVQEARRIYAQAQTQGPLVEGGALASARVNLIVNDAPFADSPLKAHIDTSGDQLRIETGHLERPDVTVAMGYDTAKSLFVAGDVQTLMQAFLAGRIRVDGDLTKLLDPRSGIWPGAGAVSSAGPLGIGLGPSAASTGAQAALDLPPSPAQEVARLLKEITE